MSISPTTTATSDDLTRTVVRGAFGGVVAAAVMAMFAMLASVTYQHHGFFTPLFHISALTGSPKAMMTSVHQAMAGHRFWFTPGAALVGAAIHMMTGAAYGVAFALIASVVPRRLIVPTGALYGSGVFVLSSFAALPAAAALTGTGSVISDMARMVGWATFAGEHLLFGLALGVMTPTATRGASPATPTRPQPARV